VIIPYQTILDHHHYARPPTPTPSSPVVGKFTTVRPRDKPRWTCHPEPQRLPQTRSRQPRRSLTHQTINWTAALAFVLDLSSHCLCVIVVRTSLHHRDCDRVSRLATRAGVEVRASPFIFSSLPSPLLPPPNRSRCVRFRRPLQSLSLDRKRLASHSESNRRTIADRASLL
jgi:hypothetical protein